MRKPIICIALGGLLTACSLLRTVFSVKSIRFIQCRLKSSLLLFNAVLLFFILLFNGVNCFSQGVAINVSGAVPNASAMLDVESTTKGFLPPRMTNEQKSAIASPATGLIVWCSNCGTTGELQMYNGTTWLAFTTGTPSISVPGTPTIGTATAGNAQATVTFTAPVFNGGSTITSYTATSTPGSFTGTLTQVGSGTITVTGLTNGTAYTLTVTATNAIGTSVASSASNSVTPATTVPGAPTIGTASAGNTQATVAFTAPASNGGSAITSYTVTSNPGGLTGTGSASPITVTGLTNGTAYTFTVTATNAIGTSVASSPSNSVTYVLSIGNTYQGGKIAYLLVSGDPGYDANVQHGLIAAPSDQSTGIIWAVTAYQSTSVPGTLTTLGSGAANTAKIIAQNGAGTTYAAGLAKAYTGGGYSDWYLPSKDELNKLWVNLGSTPEMRTANGFAVAAYWSSTESNIGSPYAWAQVFDGYQPSYSKSSAYYVRAVRAF